MNGHTPISILLADDHGAIRSGIRQVLESAGPRLRVMADEAVDGTEAVRLARQLDPDVVLMDVSMPGLSGIEATRLIVSLTRSRVVMLSLHGDEQVVAAAIRAGASEYVLKNNAARDVVPAIERAMAGARPERGAPAAGPARGPAAGTGEGRGGASAAARGDGSATAADRGGEPAD